MIKFAKGNYFKNITFQDDLLVMLYQLIKFEVPSYNNSRNSLITSFQCPKLLVAITLKILYFFANNSSDNQLIISLSSCNSIFRYHYYKF